MPEIAADFDVELERLRGRMARIEAARARAEARLEESSRVLAQAHAEHNNHQELLSSELNQKTRQLLDAQRVAGFGTMIWDIDTRRGEISPYCQAIIGLNGSLEIGSLRPFLRRMVIDDRPRFRKWARMIEQRFLSPIPLAKDAMEQAQVPPLAEARTGSAPGPTSLKFNGAGLGIELRIIGAQPQAPNRMIRVMAQSGHDALLDRTLIFLTLQDITREVEAANEAISLRQCDQQRLLELEALTEELSRARDLADSANAAKTRFLAMMSHDIRTPLNGVIGMLALFDDGGLSDAQRETLALIRGSSEQLRVLLNDIIDLEQAQSGKMTINPQPVDVEQFLHEALGFWAQSAQEKGLAFAVERMAFDWGEQAPQRVLTDCHRLRQIVDNLLSNAIKFTAKGAIRVRIGLIDAARMRFEVIDNGPGIPPERHQELFEDFSQLHSATAQPGGSGLGLAICRRIVGLMGGEIGVRAGPDNSGCCFWVELPWRADRRAGPPRRDPLWPLRFADGRRPRILVAEDVETNRIVARGLLTRLGCEVDLVGDGAQAVAAVQGSSYDLVFMDMAMPVIDGPSATRLIRALPGTKGQIPVFALTAYSRPEELAPMISAGVQGSVTKPIVLNQLYSAIRSVCPAQADPRRA